MDTARDLCIHNMVLIFKWIGYFYTKDTLGHYTRPLRIL